MNPYTEPAPEIQMNESRVGLCLAISIALLMSLVPVVPLPLKYVGAIATVILTGLSWKKPSFFLGFFATIGLGILLTRIPYAQVVLALTIGLYLSITYAAPRLRLEFSWISLGLSWLRVGQFTRDSGLLCMGTVLASAVALAGWFCYFKPDIADIIRLYVPDYPLALLILGVVVFALVNAALEEIAYRGIVLGALIHSAVPPGIAVLLQALAFGAIHIHGFPRGWTGVGLATVYGFLMGILRIQSKGLLVPWLGHALTDLVIGAMVVAAARPEF